MTSTEASLTRTTAATTAAFTTVTAARGQPWPHLAWSLSSLSHCSSKLKGAPQCCTRPPSWAHVLLCHMGKEPGALSSHSLHPIF